MPADPIREQEYAEEAADLARLPKADQKEIIALHRSVADDPKVPKVDRQAARERADALEKHLRRMARKDRGKS